MLILPLSLRLRLRRRLGTSGIERDPVNRGLTVRRSLRPGIFTNDDDEVALSLETTESNKRSELALSFIRRLTDSNQIIGDPHFTNH